ncbi:hypothetical protein CYMTET_21696 [Cymbomonas tetramitiformis]|uniref:Uncharacterized protein n=1 Tax=Cymbomonas tetramitiformis TaxID=36881 RepID=A0AAE0L2M8_9CHLO|nr:hypothetical protein CYMTET_21696 [Cymbomonas tetramitiformis]
MGHFDRNAWATDFPPEEVGTPRIRSNTMGASRSFGLTPAASTSSDSKLRNVLFGNVLGRLGRSGSLDSRPGSAPPAPRRLDKELESWAVVDPPLKPSQSSDSALIATVVDAQRSTLSSTGVNSIAARGEDPASEPSRIDSASESADVAEATITPEQADEAATAVSAASESADVAEATITPEQADEAATAVSAASESADVAEATITPEQADEAATAVPAASSMALVDSEMESGSALPDTAGVAEVEAARTAPSEPGGVHVIEQPNRRVSVLCASLPHTKARVRLRVSLGALSCAACHLCGARGPCSGRGTCAASLGMSGSFLFGLPPVQHTAGVGRLLATARLLSGLQPVQGVTGLNLCVAVQGASCVRYDEHKAAVSVRGPPPPCTL